MDLHPYSVEPFVPPADWTMHTILAFESRVSVCLQQARRLPKDEVYLRPAIEKLPQWVHVIPASTEHCLMSIERITGVIDDGYFQKYVKELQLEPWGIPCARNYARRYPWFEYLD